MMQSLEDIKKRFENKSYSERMDFLNEYHFKDSYRDYYHEFIILNLKKIKDSLYLSELIDFCGYMNFDDKFIYNNILDFLNHKDFLVQLAVFDYLKRVNRFYQEKESENIVLGFLERYVEQTKGKDFFIPFMAYQILIELKVYQKNILQSKSYFEKYISLLEESENSAMVWRAYNDAHNEPNLFPFKKKIIDLTSKMNIKYDFKHKIPNSASER